MNSFYDSKRFFDDRGVIVREHQDGGALIQGWSDSPIGPLRWPRREKRSFARADADMMNDSEQRRAMSMPCGDNVVYSAYLLLGHPGRRLAQYSDTGEVVFRPLNLMDLSSPGHILQGECQSAVCMGSNRAVSTLFNPYSAVPVAYRRHNAEEDSVLEIVFTAYEEGETDTWSSIIDQDLVKGVHIYHLFHDGMCDKHLIRAIKIHKELR